MKAHISTQCGTLWGTAKRNTSKLFTTPSITTAFEQKLSFQVESFQKLWNQLIWNEVNYVLILWNNFLICQVDDTFLNQERDGLVLPIYQNFSWNLIFASKSHQCKWS